MKSNNIFFTFDRVWEHSLIDILIQTDGLWSLHIQIYLFCQHNDQNQILSILSVNTFSNQPHLLKTHFQPFLLCDMCQTTSLLFDRFHWTFWIIRSFWTLLNEDKPRLGLNDFMSKFQSYRNNWFSICLIPLSFLALWLKCYFS